MRRSCASCSSGDRGAPPLVERDQGFGARRQAAPGEPGVEGLRIVADGFDVMHGNHLKDKRAAQRPVAEHVEGQARHYQNTADKLNRRGRLAEHDGARDHADDRRARQREGRDGGGGIMRQQTDLSERRTAVPA